MIQRSRDNTALLLTFTLIQGKYIAIKTHPATLLIISDGAEVGLHPGNKTASVNEERKLGRTDIIRNDVACSVGIDLIRNGNAVSLILKKSKSRSIIDITSCRKIMLESEFRVDIVVG